MEGMGNEQVANVHHSHVSASRFALAALQGSDRFGFTGHYDPTNKTVAKQSPGKPVVASRDLRCREQK
jgi:hypothetical protein